MNIKTSISLALLAGAAIAAISSPSFAMPNDQLTISGTDKSIAVLAAPDSSSVTAQPVSLYPSELAAVKAAADIYNPLSIRENREYMGTLYNVGDQFAYTVTSGVPGASSIELKIPPVDWDNIVAFWHTHGNRSPERRYFSDVDTQTVEKYGKPFYLADYTGVLKVFRPGGLTMPSFAAHSKGLGHVRGMATGEYVTDDFNRTVKVNAQRSAYCPAAG